jgi:ribosome maturation factor RimP
LRENSCKSFEQIFYEWAVFQPIFFEYMADIFSLSQQALASLDVELVDIEWAALGLLRVTIDRPEGVRIEDCEAVSRQLSRVFEVENIDYRRLEVGSPGIDRPLKKQADFQRFVGEHVEVKLREAVDGRKVFSGVLAGIAPAGGTADTTTQFERFGIEFEAKKGETQQVTFTFSDVERAKLDPVLDFKGKKR